MTTVTDPPKGESRTRNPWGWIPSLYVADGLPYVVAMTVSVILYKRLGISNSEIAFYTSWLYLPWVIKPLWSPFVEMIGTKRNWIVIAELLIGGLLAGVALTLPLSGFFQYSLAVFWLMAFSSATHDIAVDGFYMLALPQKQQSAFVGVRSTFYRIAMISGQGALVVLAGYLEEHSGGTSARHGPGHSPLWPQGSLRSLFTTDSFSPIRVQTDDLHGRAGVW